MSVGANLFIISAKESYKTKINGPICIEMFGYDFFLLIFKLR